MSIDAPVPQATIRDSLPVGIFPSPALHRAEGFFTHNLRVASLADMTFITALAKRFTNEIGFLPREAVAWYLENSRVVFALENQDPCGFVLGRTHLRWNRLLRPITQAAVHFDAQRRNHGLALVKHVAAMASDAGQSAVQAMCRDGLDANEFWRLAGFVHIGSYSPGNKRRRLMHCWRKLLTAQEPAWFRIMPPVAGWKGKKTNAEQSSITVEQPSLFPGFQLSAVRQGR